MVIEINLQYSNKTLSIATPLLKYYGNEFVEKLSSVFKLGIGIGDDSTDLPFEESAIFILIDSLYQPEDYKIFKNYISSHSSYITHYHLDQNSREVMFVLRVPENTIEAYKAFKKGKYSKMFSKEQIEEIYTSVGQNYIKNILLRNQSKKLSHIKEVNKKFATEITDFEIEDFEVEFPLIYKQEIFFPAERKELYLN